jgi:hypothetical protein
VTSALTVLLVVACLPALVGPRGERITGLVRSPRWLLFAALISREVPSWQAPRRLRGYGYKPRHALVQPTRTRIVFADRNR